jgi:hypothetical protein
MKEEMSLFEASQFSIIAFSNIFPGPGHDTWCSSGRMSCHTSEIRLAPSHPEWGLGALVTADAAMSTWYATELQVFRIYKVKTLNWLEKTTCSVYYIYTLLSIYFSVWHSIEMEGNRKFNNRDTKNRDEQPIFQAHQEMDIISAMYTVKQHLAYVICTYIWYLQQGVHRSGPGHNTWCSSGRTSETPTQNKNKNSFNYNLFIIYL